MLRRPAAPIQKFKADVRDTCASEQAFRILLEFLRNVMRIARLNDRHLRRTGMKKLGIALAALGAIIIAAPSIASAETVVIKRGGYHGHHHGYGAPPNSEGTTTAATIADGAMVITTGSWSSRSIATEADTLN
jgi:hypothetical protein